MSNILRGAMLSIITTMGVEANTSETNFGEAYPPVYYIVLAGGNGERLWPYSSQELPKQLLSIEGDETLIEQAINRLERVKRPQDHIWVCTTAIHYEKIANLLTDKVSRIIKEPCNRNTGPAILYACHLIYAENPRAGVLFVPADSFIPKSDYDIFADAIRAIVTTALQNSMIALVGVKPTMPATGYGYIEYNTQDTQQELYRVFHFHEKPTLNVAQKYITQQNMLWNISIFGGDVQLFLQEFELHSPDIYAAVNKFVTNVGQYEESPSLSIDYAVIEKSGKIWVLPVTFSWCDVGNISTFLSLKKEVTQVEDPQTPSKVIIVDGNNNLIDVPNKLVAVIGVDDLCVVQTDDVLLITKSDDAEKVRLVVAQLRKSELLEYL